MSKLQSAHIQLAEAVQNIVNVLADYDLNASNCGIFQNPEQLEKLMSIVMICFDKVEPSFLQVFQKMIACFNTAFKDITDKFSFDFTLRMYYTFTTNWKVGYNIKKFMRTSFLTILQYWPQELDQFFQKLVLEISKSLDLIRQYNNGTTFTIQSQPIFNQTSHKMYSYVINMPSDEVYVYESLMFLMEGLFSYHKQDAESPNVQNILTHMHILRKVINHIFALENLMRFKDSVKIALQILSEIVRYDSDRLKDIVYAELYKWQELFLMFQAIYRFQTVQDQFTPHGYNYLVWDEHSKDLAQIKQQAADVHAYLCSQSGTNLPVLFQDQFMSLVSNDLMGSLKYFASYRGEVPEQLDNMSQQYLALYINYFQIINAELDEMKQVLLTLLLPIFKRQIENRQALFIDDPKDLMAQIDECLEDTQSYHVLSHCCYIMDIILSDNDDFVEFVAKYLTASLIDNKEQLYNLSGSYQALDKKTCFFILQTTCLTHRNCSTFITLFQYLLTPDYFNQMNSYEKAYLYGYLGSEWSLIYRDNPKSGEFYLDYIFDSDISQSLKLFVLNFIYNVTVEYYSQNFFFKFLMNFQSINPQDDAINIVSRNVQYHRNKFSDGFTVQIIRAIVGSIDKYIPSTTQLDGKLLIVENRFVASILYELGCISKIKSLCHEKSEIFRQLLKFVINFMKLSKVFMLEDPLGQILCNLLELCKDMPQQLLPVVKQFMTIYRNYEYQGIVVLRIMNRVFRLSANNDEMLSLLFGGLIEAISYFSFFPEAQDIISQYKFQINNHLIILQHALLVYGDRLPFQSREDMLNIAKNLVINIEVHNQKFKIPETLLQARIFNFKIILEIYQNYPFSLDDLVQKTKNHVFSNYDAQLLIFILDRIKCSFGNEQDRFNLLRIMANLLKTIKEHETKKRKYLKLLDERKHLNQLLSNLIIPITLQQKVETGVSSLISSFIQIDPKFAEMIQYLDEIDKDAINKVMVGSVAPDSKQQPAQTSNGRQMFKIVNKRKECDTTMLDEFHTFKRNIHKRSHQNLSEDSDNDVGYTQNRKKKNKDMTKSQRINEKFMKRLQKK